MKFYWMEYVEGSKTTLNEKRSNLVHIKLIRNNLFVSLELYYSKYSTL